jgi:hypothetical protein
VQSIAHLYCNCEPHPLIAHVKYSFLEAGFKIAD